MKHVWILLPLLILLGATGTARAQAESDASLQTLMRQTVAAEMLRQEDAGENTETPAIGFSKETAARVKHGLWSLIFPGWSQLRGGHNTRAVGFATAEVLIWSSYIAFQLQGHSREDAYQDFAQRFAGVQGDGRDDNYWRAVASHANSDDYNEQVRRAIRAGVNEDPLYEDGDAWRWQSNTKFDQYRLLRRDSLDSYDRATLVLLFAVVNRVVSVVDAIRSGPRDLQTAQAQQQGTRFFVDAAPEGRDVTTRLVMTRSF